MAGRVSRANTAIGATIARGNDAALKSMGAYKQTFKGIAAEAALGAGATGATAFGAEEVLGRQYGIEDVAIDFLASVGISYGLHAIGGYIGKVWLKTSHAKDIEAIHSIVTSQLQNGEKPDIRPAIDAQMAERYVPMSTLRPDQRVPEVTRIGRKQQYEAVYAGEEGIYAGVRGRGKTPDEALADLQSIYETGRVKAEEYNTSYTPEYYREALRVQEKRDALKSFDIDAEEKAAFKQITGESIDDFENRLIDLEKEIENVRATRGDNKAKKLEKKLDAASKKYDDAFGMAVNNVDARYSTLKNEAMRAQKDLVKYQKKLTAPKLKEWMDRQLSSDPRGRVAGTDDINTQAYVDEANKVQNGDPAVSSAADDGEIAGLQSMLTDDNIDAEFKKSIESQLKQIETATKMPEAYRAYVACMNKG
jgi:hypothetical protein